MKNNICNFPCKITVGGHSFECDYNHQSVDVLETVLGLGFFEIYDRFLFKNNLSGFEIIEVIAFSALKHHGFLGVEKLRQALINKQSVSVEEFAVFKVHFKNILPDIVQFSSDLQQINPKYQKSLKSSAYYDFEGNYALARKYLLWSDEEFWSATPKKLCFALISFAKYEKQKEKFLQTKQTEDCINFLNGIKRML